MLLLVQRLLSSNNDGDHDDDVAAADVAAADVADVDAADVDAADVDAADADAVAAHEDRSGDGDDDGDGGDDDYDDEVARSVLSKTQLTQVYFDSPSAGFPMYQKLLAKD